MRRGSAPPIYYRPAFTDERAAIREETATTAARFGYEA
jgi:hypothetical protein